MEWRISSPCPKSWEDLVGNDRVRYCGQCKLNVYNFADMSRAEAEAIVRKTEGRICGRLYVRGDRTATSQDCPRSGLRKRIGAALTAGALLLLGAFGALLREADAPPATAYPAWVQAVIDWIDPPPPPPRILLGELPMPRNPLPPPASPE
jgi:hypothetical protein